MAPALREDDKATIVALHTQGYTQAEIIRHVRDTSGQEIKRSTLSDFLRGHPKPGRAEVYEEKEPDRVLAPVGTRVEVQTSAHDATLANFAKATAEEVVDRLAQVIEGVQQLKREGESHYEALSTKIDTLRKQLRGEVPRSTLRRIWVRTGVAWLLALILFFVWQPTLVPKTAMQIRGQGEALWSTVSVWVWGPSAVAPKPNKKAGR